MKIIWVIVALAALFGEAHASAYDDLVSVSVFRFTVQSPVQFHCSRFPKSAIDCNFTDVWVDPPTARIIRVFYDHGREFEKVAIGRPAKGQFVVVQTGSGNLYAQSLKLSDEDVGAAVCVVIDYPDGKLWQECLGPSA